MVAGDNPEKRGLRSKREVSNDASAEQMYSDPNNPISTPWTEEEVEKLISFVGQGMPVHEIGAQLKRGAAEITQEMQELAITFAGPQQIPPPNQPGQTSSPS